MPRRWDWVARQGRPSRNRGGGAGAGGRGRGGPRGGGATGGGSANYWAQTILYIDAANFGLTDQSPATKGDLTASGTATISGGYFDATGGNEWWLYADDPDWTFSGDFTVEVWGAHFTSLPAPGSGSSAFKSVVAHWDEATNQRSWRLDRNGNSGTGWIRGSVDDDGLSPAALSVATSAIPVINTDYDYALERSGNTVRVYAGGSMVGKGTFSGSLKNSNRQLLFCANGAFGGVKFKACRITSGVARYATDSGYTVPTLPLGQV